MVGCFCSIVPPHLLRELARHGTQEQRREALRDLEIDATTRMLRSLYAEDANRFKAMPGILPGMRKTRTIMDANHQEQRFGNVVRSEGQPPVIDGVVNEAYDELGATYDFFETVYQRPSIDGRGSPLYGVVHYGERYNNAFWDGQHMVFGDGDGQIFHRFTICLDVVAHELTHGVVAAEADLMYLHQAGSLNESMADVFGSLVKQYSERQTVEQADWLIGKGIFVSDPSAALRSMKDPGTAYDLPVLGKDPQPGHFKHYVDTMQDNGGVHLNSGIPNHAFYLAAMEIGGYAWEKTGKIWYSTLRDPRLKKTSGFVDFAHLASINAGHLYGSQSSEKRAVETAFRSVGIPTLT